MQSFHLAICQDVERNPGSLAHCSTGCTYSPPRAISPTNNQSSHAQIVLLEAICIKLHYVYSKPLVFLSTKDIVLERLNKLLPINSSCRDCRSLNIQLVTSNGVNLTVLKPLRSLQSSSLPSNNLCFALCNAHFIGNKVETVIDHAIGNDISLCIFTETWLKDLDSVCIADLSRHSYFFKSFPWQKSICWWCRHFIPQLF